MPDRHLILTVLREAFTAERSPRVTEPGLVMDDLDQVTAYVAAGRERGVMAPVYLYHAANISEILRPGDTVLDLACGPANQLAMVARLNPQAQFTGLDLSQPMLDQAGELIAQKNLSNVTLRHGDITDLSAFGTASIDAVMSTMALHHLPDVAALIRTYTEVARVLKPGGGVYMVDFGHLKAKRSIDYFANQYQDRQPPLFTLDYLNSLRAAFYLKDIRQAVQPLLGQAKLYSTFVMPYMVALKSAPRRGHDSALAAELATLKAALPAWHQKDYVDIINFFRGGGLTCRFLP